MKLSRKILIGCLSASLLLLYSFYFYQNQVRLQTTRFNEAESIITTKAYNELAYQPENFHLVTKKYDKHELNLIIPENEEGETPPDLTKKLDELAEKMTAQQKNNKYVKLFITGIPEIVQEQITRYTYQGIIYRWNKKQNSWKKELIEFPDQTLIDQQTGKIITLGGLFSNQKNLSILRHRIQQELLAKVENPEEKLEQILALPLLLDNEANFTLQRGKVTLHFPNQVDGLTDYPVKFADVADLVNPRYLNPEDIHVVPIIDVPKKTAKQVALTFDDGPNNTTSLKILDILEKETIVGTFFMLGKQVQLFPDIAKKISDSGHELANHSFSHANLVTLTPEQTSREINETQKEIYQATGILPTYVRPPYGSFDYDTAIAIGLPLVNWTVDTLDWKNDGTKALMNRVTAEVAPGGIILMHDIHQSTVDALPKMITELRKQGYEFVTVSELLHGKNDPMTIHYADEKQRNINPNEKNKQAER